MATTLTDIFTSYLDITSPPNSTLLSTLADNANALNERKALKNLAKVSKFHFLIFISNLIQLF